MEIKNNSLRTGRLFLRSIGEVLLTLMLLIVLPVNAQTAPSAPTEVSLVSIKGGLQLYFTPPSSDGGSSITAYTATCTPMLDHDLARRNNCMACHQIDKKVVGPALLSIASKYAGDGSAEKTLIAKVKAGGSGVWGAVPMPANSGVTDPDIKTLVKWILSGCSTLPRQTITTSGIASPIGVAGLTNGLNYICTVSAINSYGVGVKSEEVTQLVEWPVPVNISPILNLLLDD